jgi:hypothetical protein
MTFLQPSHVTKLIFMPLTISIMKYGRPRNVSGRRMTSHFQPWRGHQPIKVGLKIDHNTQPTLISVAVNRMDHVPHRH